MAKTTRVGWPALDSVSRQGASFVARNTELRYCLLKIIGKQRHSEQVRSRALVVRAGGLCPQFVPIVDRPIPAAEPYQCNEIDLFVLAHGKDCRRNCRSTPTGTDVASFHLMHGGTPVERYTRAVDHQRQKRQEFPSFIAAAHPEFSFWTASRADNWIRPKPAQVRNPPKWQPK